MNHFAPAPFGTASLAARIPSPLQRETARDAWNGATVIANTDGSIIREQAEKIAKLEAALKPFAEAAHRINYFDGEHYNERLYAGDHSLRELLDGIDGHPLRVQHLRAARAALATEKLTMADNLADIIARLEKATGPDWGLDRDIAVSLIGWCLHPNKERSGAQSDTGFDCPDCKADSWGNTGPTGQRWSAQPPDCTASLDAAVALAARVLPGCSVTLGDDDFDDMRPYAILSQRLGGNGGKEIVACERAPSMQLALCLVIVRAVAAKGTPHGR